MFKEVLQHIDGIAVWPVISLVLFFIVFITMLVIVFKRSKQLDEYMSALPLEENNKSINEGVIHG